MVCWLVVGLLVSTGSTFRAYNLIFGQYFTSFKIIRFHQGGLATTRATPFSVCGHFNMQAKCSIFTKYTSKFYLIFTDSATLLSPPNEIYFEASHWPSDHMSSSRPLIGQPPYLIAICESICICQEIWCLPYAGF